MADVNDQAGSAKNASGGMRDGELPPTAVLAGKGARRQTPTLWVHVIAARAIGLWSRPLHCRYRPTYGPVSVNVRSRVFRGVFNSKYCIAVGMPSFPPATGSLSVADAVAYSARTPWVAD